MGASLHLISMSVVLIVKKRDFISGRQSDEMDTTV